MTRPLPLEMGIDIEQAARHIARLTNQADGLNAPVIFQTFDDQKQRMDSSLARTIFGSLKQCCARLDDYQRRGAGAFVTVAAMQGKRRVNAQWAAARAVFKEDDEGISLDPPLDPHLVIESSPNKRHVYFMTTTTDRAAWSAVQATVVDRYGSDPNAKDLARVLRLAGSLHQKDPKNVHRVRILDLSPEAPYAWEKIVAAIQPLRPVILAPPPKPVITPSVATDFAASATIRDLRSALCHLDHDDRKVWIDVGLALKPLGEFGFELYEEFSKRSPSFYDEPDFRKRWDGYEPTTIDHRAIFNRAAQRGWVNPGSKKNSASTNFVPSIRSAEEILKMAIPEMRWVVPEIVAEGVTLLVASPKIGKSWLALQVSLAVCAGTTVLGRRAAKGRVLFLGLEDGNRRLKDRLTKLGAHRLPPEAQRNLQFETEWPRVDQGGIEHIEAWLTANTDARLVVVDVLQKIRPPRTAKGNVYEEDYDAIRRLKEISEKYRIAILVLHHTRKSTADDVLETVSGSQGLTGAVDAALIIKRPRGEETAELYVTGRDLPSEGHYVVTFGKISCTWTMVGAVSEVAPTKERAEIMDLLTDGVILSPSEIARECGKTRPNIAKMLRKMREDGMVMQVGRGKYTLKKLVTTVTNDTLSTEGME